MADNSKKSVVKKLAADVKRDNERGARVNLIEELFFDFNRSKSQVFWMNFQRGIFFGVGSLVGGTLVIVVFGWLLSSFVDLPGGVGEFVKNVLEAMNRPR
ncbi:MAG TPA: DUF5665 domain-containing protein [Candidatus Saccharimonadales bacterium]